MFRFLLLSFDIGFCVIYLMEIQQEQQEEKEEVPKLIGEFESRNTIRNTLSGDPVFTKKSAPSSWNRNI
jgi:hypothetical protein